MPFTQQSRLISFGPFQLDPDTGSLEKHGVPVRLAIPFSSDVVHIDHQ